MIRVTLNQKSKQTKKHIEFTCIDLIDKGQYYVAFFDLNGWEHCIPKHNVKEIDWNFKLIKHISL